MSYAIPTVFVVDDDISVRELLDLLIRNAGWRPELFESAQEFLSHPRVFVQTVWFSTLVFRISMVSICRSTSRPIGRTCRLSSSRAMVTFR